MNTANIYMNLYNNTILVRNKQIWPISIINISVMFRCFLIIIIIIINTCLPYQ